MYSVGSLEDGFLSLGFIASLGRLLGRGFSRIDNFDEDVGRVQSSSIPYQNNVKCWRLNTKVVVLKSTIGASHNRFIAE